MAQLQFNATQFNPELGSAPLPVAKKQLMIITDSSIEAAKGNSQNGLLVLSVQYVDGPHAGAEGVHRLNIFHQDQGVKERANRELSAICHVLGLQGINDTAELHHKPFRADVDYQKGHNPATDGAEAKGYTNVGKVYDQNGNPAKAGIFGAQQAQQQPQQMQQVQTQQQQPQQFQQQPAQQPAQQPQGQQWGGAQQPVQQGNGQQQQQWGNGGGNGAAWK